MESEGDVEFLGNDNDMVIGEIDWDVLLEGANALDALELELENPVVPATGSSSSSSSSTVEDAPANPSPDSFPSWIGEIETILMKDDDDGKKVVASTEEPSNQFYQDFIADILVESPSTDGPTDVDSNACADSEKEKLGGSPLNDDVDADADADADDPISKKRRRQLRNKDAAMRSRERRKTYVNDLEMKSKYFEAECRRLGRLLQTCYAENHALRLSLQMSNVYGASATKQESAVLLELLLLGSLLWLVDIICPLALPLMALLLNRGRVPRDNLGRKALKSVGPREAGSKMFGHLVLQSFVKSRRCKASRTKMKQSFLVS